MARASDNCVMPISEINKMSKELRDLRRIVSVMMSTAQFAGESVMGLEVLPEDAHPDSICTIKLKQALRLRWLLKPARPTSRVSNGEC